MRFAFTVALPVWTLQTGKRVEKCNFKHPAPVQCVRISSARVYSSCDRGLVKVWDLESMSLLRVSNSLTSLKPSRPVGFRLVFYVLKVMDAHRSSVRCLFLDELHLLSADVDGQVMAWSGGTDVKRCLMTFKHPK